VEAGFATALAFRRHVSRVILPGNLRTGGWSRTPRAENASHLLTEKAVGCATESGWPAFRDVCCPQGNFARPLKISFGICYGVSRL
jgi:hypothetical protein